MKFEGNRHSLIFRLPKGKRCAEVGVQSGWFAAAILTYAGPEHLILIDLWKHQPPEIYDDAVNLPDTEQADAMGFVLRRFKREIDAHLVTIMRGYSVEQLARLPENSLDWVYLDANHSEACVLADLEAIRRVLVPDGYILGHDYCGGSEGHTYGVIAAVAKFLDNHPDMMLFTITEEDFPTYMLVPRSREAELTLRVHRVHLKKSASNSVDKCS